MPIVLRVEEQSPLSVVLSSLSEDITPDASLMRMSMFKTMAQEDTKKRDIIAKLNNLLLDGCDARTRAEIESDAQLCEAARRAAAVYNEIAASVSVAVNPLRDIADTEGSQGVGVTPSGSVGGTVSSRVPEVDTPVFTGTWSVADKFEYQVAEMERGPTFVQADRDARIVLDLMTDVWRTKAMNRPPSSEDYFELLDELTLDKFNTPQPALKAHAKAIIELRPTANISVLDVRYPKEPAIEVDGIIFVDPCTLR